MFNVPYSMRIRTYIVFHLTVQIKHGDDEPEFSTILSPYIIRSMDWVLVGLWN